MSPPPMTHQESTRTVEMHIPGAWVGTNPSTPAPISEDLKYFGDALKTLPATVQGYLPKKEDGSPATAVDYKEKAISMIPANVMNTVTNYMPASMQPTMSPTAADKPPEPSPTPKDTSNTTGESPTLKDRIAGALPASVVGTASAYLPAALNPSVSPTPADARPANQQQAPADDTTILPTTNSDITPTVPEYQQQEEKEAASNKTWTETAASILPAGAIGAISSYLPSSLQSDSIKAEEVPTPVGTHENLNAPLPPIPPANDAIKSANAPLIGSTVSPDQDVQEALAKAANPEQFKTVVVSPETSSISQPSERTVGDDSVVASTRAIGGQTPVTPGSEAPSSETDGDGYPEHGEKVTASGFPAPAGLVAGVGVATLATDHALRDQREAAESAQRSKLSNTQTQESFTHVVIPATPGAGLQEQEMFEKKESGGLMAHSPTKKHKKDRSGSISAGEASPSSPSKNGGVFGSIRKLTKKGDRSASRGARSHSRGHSVDHSNTTKEIPAIPTEDRSNSTGESDETSPTSTKKERSVLHKDPPAGYKGGHSEGENNGANGSGSAGSLGQTTVDANPGSDAAQATHQSPNKLSNPFSPTLPPSSPSKVAFKDKIKGEFMVVQGKLSRDEQLKEAGEKMKKGTL
ncbi:hypothetical protein FRC17_005549 [Serendipita sp. 399]|nr:hypothetical protein FRC17_005549 [Serendipita sp. 399]